MLKIGYRLLLSPGGGDTFDEKALGEEEENDHGDNDQSRGSHKVVPVGSAAPALVGLQAESQREVPLLGQVNQGTEKIIPGSHELEQRHHDKRGLGQRENDVPKDLPFAAAVDTRRFRQFPGQREKELPEQKDIEGTRHEARHPQRLEAARPPDRFKQGVEWHHDNRKGNHHGGEHEDKNLVTPFPFYTGKTVGGNGAAEHRPDNGHKA